MYTKYAHLEKFDSKLSIYRHMGYQFLNIAARSENGGSECFLARAPRELSAPRPIPGLVAAELIPRSRSMHERFDQRCEIPKSLRGRVRAFDVHAGKGRLGGLGSGRAGGGGGGGGGRRTRASAVGAGLAMRTCQEQRLCPLPPPLPPLPPALSLAYLLVRISPDSLIRVSFERPPCVDTRVTCNRSLFLIWSLEEQNGSSCDLFDWKIRHCSLVPFLHCRKTTASQAFSLVMARVRR